MHNLPRLRELERRWSHELVVVGVHSPKFPHERDTESVRRAVARLGVRHPVVNDRDFRLFRAYTARAWPTLMFIDPQGKVIGRHEGEFALDAVDDLLRDMVAEFDARAVLDRRPLVFDGERAPATLLSFPGKCAVDEATDRLVVADTGHDRIVVAGLDGTVRATIGGGRAGFDDGPADRATFRRPQGVVLHGDMLYVADTENHALRAIDLGRLVVTTVAGTGEQALGRRGGERARGTALASPWDLVVLDDTLYVAMAGAHQVWAMPLGGDRIEPYAGSGREALVDGRRAVASMSQPSGITTDGRRLYVADSEASAIRAIDPGPDGEVRTIVGEGLFEFGDRDGVGPVVVRLQHPLGVAWADGVVWIADTYNHRLKRLDPRTTECRTVFGAGASGRADGVGAEARFSEPSGLAVAGGRLLVADTNNHAIRVADLASGAVRTLALGVPEVR